MRSYGYFEKAHLISGVPTLFASVTFKVTIVIFTPQHHFPLFHLRLLYLARDFTAFVVQLIIIAEVKGVVVYQRALTPKKKTKPEKNLERTPFAPTITNGPISPYAATVYHRKAPRQRKSPL